MKYLLVIKCRDADLSDDKENEMLPNKRKVGKNGLQAK